MAGGPVALLTAALSLSARWPTGTFSGALTAGALRQRVLVTTKEGEHTGRVALRGVINADDEFWLEGACVRVGPSLDAEMRRWRVEFVGFDVNGHGGTVCLRAPPIGAVNMTLRAV